MTSLSTHEIAALYSEVFETTLAQLKSKGLDPQDAQVRAAARDVANMAVKQAVRA